MITGYIKKCMLEVVGRGSGWFIYFAYAYESHDYYGIYVILMTVTINACELLQVCMKLHEHKQKYTKCNS